MAEHRGQLRRVVGWWEYLYFVWFGLFTIGAVIAATQGEWERFIFWMIGIGGATAWLLIARLAKRS